MVNVNYAAKVEKTIAEKLGITVEPGTYKPGNTWYEHEMTQPANGEEPKAMALCHHKTNKNKYYLQYYPTKSKNAYALEDGTPIANDFVEKFLKEKSHSDFKPTVITIGLENILSLRASGIVMNTQDMEEAQELLEAAK